MTVRRRSACRQLAASLPVRARTTPSGNKRHTSATPFTEVPTLQLDASAFLTIHVSRKDDDVNQSNKDSLRG